jgi:hypothetical protein
MSKTIALAAAVAALLPVAQAQASQGVSLDQYGRLLVGGQDIATLVAPALAESAQTAAGGANLGCDPTVAVAGGANLGCDPTMAVAGGANLGCDPTMVVAGGANLGCDPTQAFAGGANLGCDPTIA